MRPTLWVPLLAAIAVLGTAACSNASSSANTSAEQAAAATAAPTVAVASAAPADAGSAAGAPPVYPGATAAARPKDVINGAPPDAKAYVTSDSFAKVRAWYKANLKGAPELGAPDHKKGMDVFLFGDGKTGMIIMLQDAGAKTWVVIGPPGP